MQLGWIENSGLLAKPFYYPQAGKNRVYDLHIMCGPFVGRMISGTGERKKL